LRIAAQLEVKDEAEIIEQSIAHLYAIGVDHITVVDVGSTDGTLEIVEKYRSDDFWITRLTDRAVSAEATPEDVQAFEGYKSAPADWVILLDADEFWIPASGSIKECEALDLLDVVSVQRYNIPLGPEGPKMPNELVPGRYDDLLLIASTLPELQKQLVANPDTPWILGAAEPKVMVRPKMVPGTIMGNHDVVQTDAPLRRAKASDLLVAHLPLTSRRRFERKVANISAWFARDGVDLFSGSGTWQNEPLAWHWRRWAALARDGKIGEEFDRNTFDEAQIAGMRNQGSVLSAAELLARGCVVQSKT
jgi:glycosyltransferase involved in cell wall biosynthesis